MTGLLGELGHIGRNPVHAPVTPREIRAEEIEHLVGHAEESNGASRSQHSSTIGALPAPMAAKGPR
jgi:hypothetical protein